MAGPMNKLRMTRSSTAASFRASGFLPDVWNGNSPRRVRCGESASRITELISPSPPPYSSGPRVQSATATPTETVTLPGHYPYSCRHYDALPCLSRGSALTESRTRDVPADPTMLQPTASFGQRLL